MTPEQMEKAIEFLVEHHARFSSDLDALKETVQGLVQSTSALERQAELDRIETREAIAGLVAAAEANRPEIREAIGNLIVANEVTRDLAEKVAALQIQMSHRVNEIDRRVTDLEPK
jgi:hypothetical protein